MVDLDGMGGYMKGVIARFLLAKLIKQGRLEERLGDEKPFEIVIPVSRWQLQMLALFSNDANR